ncbi:MAG: signal peptide peptidase SppA [Candidatus Aminicenantes bacterium]|nr:signal peptide peptidase SppA [Candidatus Aminicenantes bacterium]
MKTRSYVLILVLVFFALIAGAVLAVLYDWFARPPDVPAAAYLEIPLAGALVDFAEPNVWTALLLGGRPLSVHDVWSALRKAAVDSRITGVLLRLGPLECDWAKCAEIRRAVLRFRASGKKAYAFIEEAPEFDKEYYLATACDRILLHPLGWLGITGLGGPVPFFKKALDKLGVRAEFEQAEDFKTAANAFTEEKFNPAHREMMESIVGSRFEEYVREVASARGKTEPEVKALVDRAFFHGEEAVEAGLVDALLYEDEAAALFDSRGGRSRRTTLAEYARVSPESAGLKGRRRLALMYLQGPIHGGASLTRTIGSETAGRWLRAAREDRAIAAVVLRVDSPGGSAVASDSIWREIALLGKAKPVVVSMSDLAGSGGYWIALGAAKILAQPQTLTGSIGVLAGKFDFSALFARLGVTSDTVARGARADVFSPFRAMTPEERGLLKKQVLWIYERFLAKTAESRTMPVEAVAELAKGRVWTGRQAQEAGLIDEIGGLEEAVGLAKSLAGIPAEEEVRLVVWPRGTSFLFPLSGPFVQAALRRGPRGSGPAAELLRALDWAGRLDEDMVWAVMPLALR